MKQANIQNLSYINIGIIIINVLVFLWVEWGGSSEDSLWMLTHGAMFAPYVMQKKEYYRLFTAIFLHFGVNHLANNMLILYIMGDRLERALGRIKYIIFYTFCGISSNIVSMIFHARQEKMVVSAGASGAIFGVIGGILWVVIRNQGRLQDWGIRQMVLLIILTLYFGFTSTGVDNVAHVSGLVIGFLLSMVLYRKNRYAADVR